MRILAGLWIAPLVALAQPAARPEAAELLRQSDAALKSHRSYRLESIHTIETKGAVKSKIEIPVSIAVRQPDRMRVESRSQSGHMTTMSDGDHTWMYLEPGGQYIQRSASSSPSAILSGTDLAADLPDLTKSAASASLLGQESISLGGKKFSCWVVITRYDRTDLPDRGMTMLEGSQTVWIDQSRKVVLKSLVKVSMELGGGAGRVEITQSTRTVSIELDPDLPDSFFAFTPPAGSTEIADWALPGVSRPDVIGKPAPPLRANAMNGTAVDLSEMHGGVVLLDFWATWCGPCRSELPVIEKLHQELGKQGLTVIGITVGEEAGTLTEFLKTAGLTYPIVSLDEDNDLVKRLSVTGFPTKVLIDREGHVAAYDVGAGSEQALRGDLAQLGVGVISRKHTFQGKVEAVNVKNRSLTVNGERVEGWMEAMTMNYQLDEPSASVKVKSGDRISATVYDGDLTLHDVQVIVAPNSTRHP